MSRSKILHAILKPSRSFKGLPIRLQGSPTRVNPQGLIETPGVVEKSIARQWPDGVEPVVDRVEWRGGGWLVPLLSFSIIPIIPDMLILSFMEE